MEDTTAQYETVANKASEAVQDLFFNHFPTILRKKDDDPKIDVTFKCELRGDSKSGFSLKTHVSYGGSKVSDDREDYIDPVGQGTLGFGDM